MNDVQRFKELVARLGWDQALPIVHGLMVDEVVKAGKDMDVVRIRMWCDAAEKLKEAMAALGQQ